MQLYFKKFKVILIIKQLYDENGNFSYPHFKDEEIILQRVKRFVQKHMIWYATFTSPK